MSVAAILNRPAAAGLAALLIYGALTAFLLDKWNMDASRFITAGDRFVDKTKSPPGLAVGKNSFGYDGQFYYRLALDPFTDRQTDHGIKIDSPAYRQQRILLPLIAWTLARGDPARTAWALLLVNLLAIGMIGALAGVMARNAGVHPLAGAVVALYPGLILALARSLTEVLYVALLVACFSLHEKHRPFAAAVVLGLAVLARETAIVVAAAMFVSWLFTGRRRSPASGWPLFVIPALVFVAWQGWLTLTWGQAPALSSPGRGLGAAFAGFWPFLKTVAALNDSFQIVQFLELVYLVLLGLITATLLARRNVLFSLRLSWLLYAALAFSLSSVWVEDWSYLRVLSDFGVLGLLIVLHAGYKTRRLVFTATAASWLMVAVHVLVVR